MALHDAEFARWLVASMGSGVVAVDTAGSLVALSSGARRALGLDPEELLGRSCSEVLSDHPALARLLTDTLRGRELPSRAELVLEGSRGSAPRTIGFTVVPVRDEAGELRGAALWFRDLTPYERMDEQERLRDRLAALGQMAAGLAHEIRNPLAGMEVLGGLLRRRLAEGSEERGLVEELLGELRSLADTVSASLDFVKPLVPSRASVDLAELLEESLSLASRRVSFEGRVERGYQSRMPPLLADADQLRSVLTDLIVNALEAMEASPGRSHRLRLGLHTEAAVAPVLRVGAAAAASSGGGLADGSAAELVVSIADTGPGVPQELAQRIFYPFYTTKERGNGVGLANAQKVIAGHGGSIELQSRPGGGATFRLRLPLEPRS